MVAHGAKAVFARAWVQRDWDNFKLLNVSGYSCILLELLIFNKVLIYNNCILVVLVNVKWIIDNGENECYDNDDSKNNRLAPPLK